METRVYHEKKRKVRKKYFISFFSLESMRRINIQFILLTFLVFAGSLTISASVYSDRTKINLIIEEASLNQIFVEIEKKSEFIFVYNENVVNSSIKRSISVKNKSIKEILDKLFKGIDIAYRIDGRQIFLYKNKDLKRIERRENKIEPNNQQPQQKEIKGTVKDTEGNPIPGVSVIVKGTTIGTVTNTDGEFTLTVPNDAETLQFSFVGMKTRELAIETMTKFSVVMEEDIQGMEEVVVVGYGQQEKVSVTGSISSISTEELVQSPASNISNSLAGRMSGLFAVQRSGEPGSDDSILRIRGEGTFAGEAEPLVIVDGVESINYNYNNIAPDEIEDVTILKDASATAVYGVRGANGVLIITTKRGTVGKPEISLTVNAAQNTYPFMKANMNAYQYTKGYNEALKHDSYVTGGYIPRYTEEEIQLYKNQTDPIIHPNTDWMDFILKEASYNMRNNLNIRGGTEKVKYFFSLGNFSQGGIYDVEKYEWGYNQNIHYDRYNMRSNFDFEITNRLSASLDMSFQFEQKRGGPNTQAIMNAIAQRASNKAPSPEVTGGKVVTLIYEKGFSDNDNPLTDFIGGYKRTYGNNLNGSIRFDYKLDVITKGLSARSAVSYKNHNTQSRSFGRNGLTYDAIRQEDNSVGFLPSGPITDMEYTSVGEGAGKLRSVYSEFGLEYDREFGNHDFSGLILYNQDKLFKPGLAFLVPRGYQGLVGRITYNFKKRYFGEFNLGYNGTENFAPGKRFGLFPAYSLGWTLSEEHFYPKNDYLTYIKIRGSYGEVGNDKIGGDRFLYRPTAYIYEGEYYFGEVGSTYQAYQASSEGKLGNPDLTWERAKKMNIGLDLRLWKDKIILKADLFKNKRDNILWNKGTVPIIIGMELPAYNLGEMQNRGFDGEITFNDRWKGMHFFVKGTYTYAHNEILFMDEVNWEYAYQYRTGQRKGQAFGYIDEGLFNTWEEVNDANRPIYMWNNDKIQPGDIKYKDVNGDGIIDDKDQVPIGYSNYPEITFGLSLGANYKGFDISLLFQGATNVSLHPTSRSTNGFYNEMSAPPDLLEAWSYERYIQGLPIRFPRNTVSNHSHIQSLSTYWYEDATYLRLKNMEIGYKFQKNLLKILGFSSLRIYINGNNLLTWADLLEGEDPEYPSGGHEMYPVPRTFNLGMKINF